MRCEIFSIDLNATADFYVRVLGFTVARDAREDDPPYLALTRDQVRLGAVQRPEAQARGARQPPIGVELVLETDDLDAERERARDAGWPVDTEIIDQPWGLSDFRLLDPDGSYWRLTSRRGHG